MPSTGFSRRRLLTGTAAAAAGATAAGSLLAAGESSGATATRIGFEGSHQAGITTPPPRHAIVAAFDVTAADRDELITMLRAATTECARSWPVRSHRHGASCSHPSTT